MPLGPLLTAVVHPGGMQYLAIDAKLRADNRSNQLDEYDDILRIHRISPCAKVLLTLDGTLHERNEAWNLISYARLEEIIRRECDAVGKSNIYIQDYLQLLERLGWLMGNLEKPACASLYFRGVVRHDRDEVAHDPEDSPGLFRYLLRMRLGEELQKCWMRRLGVHALALRDPLPEHWATKVGDAMCMAFLSVENVTRYPGFRVGLRIEDRTLKMYSYPVLDRNNTPATEEQQTEAATILAGMMEKAGVQGARTTPIRGFTSIAIGTAPEERDFAAWGPLVANAITKVVA